jgi:hypothetical protein
LIAVGALPFSEENYQDCSGIDWSADTSCDLPLFISMRQRDRLGRRAAWSAEGQIYQ